METRTDHARTIRGQEKLTITGIKAFGKTLTDILWAIPEINKSTSGGQSAGEHVWAIVNLVLNGDKDYDSWIKRSYPNNDREQIRLDRLIETYAELNAQKASFIDTVYSIAEEANRPRISGAYFTTDYGKSMLKPIENEIREKISNAWDEAIKAMELDKRASRT